jgi:hypothetical protein
MAEHKGYRGRRTRGQRKRTRQALMISAEDDTVTPAPPLTDSSLAALLELEAKLAADTPQGAINCRHCQDFRTDVSHGREHPCRRCQPLRFKIWRLCEVTAEDTLLVSVNGRDCLVILPPDGGSVVQPCEGPRCDQGCVLVRPADGDDGAFWAEVTELEIKTPWSGV